MGWCSGSYIADEVYNLIREYIPKRKRKCISKEIYDIYCEYDADCWEDEMNIVIDSEET